MGNDVTSSEYQPTDAQLALRRLVRDKTRVLAYGGSRSGKTFELCRTIAVLAFRYGGRYAIFRRYYNAVRSSVFIDTFPKMMRLCFGILGREFAAIYFNECSEISFSSIEVAATRLAQKRFDSNGRQLRNRLLFDCNPPGKTHWSYRLFIEGIHPVSRLRIRLACSVGTNEQTASSGRRNTTVRRNADWRGQ